MFALREITQPYQPDSEFIQNLADLFSAARRERLQFSIDLHSSAEDRHFLGAMVIPQNHVYVAETRAALAGFIAFADGWVNHLYIAPSFQRQGIGAGLLNIAKQSNPALQLWTFEINKPAIAFYQHQGFQIVERTDGSANEAKMPDVRMAWTSGRPIS